ncbi:hypothetical protein COHA_001623 [Chlorella ohadii]|uniref:Uncharacterized protein n=1 Tax=Chlorella ohadii TaxID=2649997 RepID=A0AAD5E1S4_9CHLO|nr:hypothetical protein COHA_001623 [Chlorella ohadii]
MSAALQAAKTDPAAIAAARQRLQAYLQQQSGISKAEAVRLASQLSAALGAVADQLVLAPQQWFVSRGMQPAKAAQLLVCICKEHASVLKRWPSWQPVFEANWQLADGYLSAYQQQCKATKQRPLKSGQSLAVLLSGMPSRYRMWLVSFAGSTAAATAMLQRVPELLSFSAATLDSKLAALQAAWAGVLQPEQVRQLVQWGPKVLCDCKAVEYARTAEVLCSWFAQPSELYAVLSKAPKLLSTAAASLEASKRWMTGPPLSLSRRQFVALVQASPQAFSRNWAAPLTQHKLAFLTQVAGVPLERAMSESHLNYLKSSLIVLAGRYFLLTEHGVPLPRHEDGGFVLGYAVVGLPTLLLRLRTHDSQQRLPADDDAAVEYLQNWLAAWPETDSGRRWAQAPQPAADA